MPVDPEYLREHYAALSDEALLAIERAELVDTARMYYDDEFGRRGLGSRRSVRRGRFSRLAPLPTSALREGPSRTPRRPRAM